jgi:hypothetical protein
LSLSFIQEKNYRRICLGSFDEAPKRIH